MTVSAYAARHILRPQPVAAAGGPPAGYTAWYDASQITGHADGAALASWPDLSTNHNDLTQATPANQPIYYSSTAAKLINGKPAVWFDGVAQQMNTATFATPIAQPFTVAAVWQPTAQPGYAYPFDSANALFGINGGFAFGVWATSAFINCPSVAMLALHQFAGIYQGATSVTYCDGAAGPPGDPGPGNLANIYLGGGPHGSLATGPLPEVIVWPFALTPAQIMTTYSYLKPKWGTP